MSLFIYKLYQVIKFVLGGVHPLRVIENEKTKLDGSWKFLLLLFFFFFDFADENVPLLI